MKIELVASVTKKGYIGLDNNLLHESKTDLTCFRDLTINRPCLMGSTTYRHIVKKIGHPLTNRHSIVLSKIKPSVYEKVFDRVTWVTNLEDAFAEYHRLNILDKKGEPYPLMVIGGESIYNQLLEQATKIHLTKICLDLTGDKKFPELDDSWYCHYQRPVVDGDNTLLIFQRFSRR